MWLGSFHWECLKSRFDSMRDGESYLHCLVLRKKWSRREDSLGNVVSIDHCEYRIKRHFVRDCWCDILLRVTLAFVLISPEIVCVKHVSVWLCSAEPVGSTFCIRSRYKIVISWSTTSKCWVPKNISCCRTERTYWLKCNRLWHWLPRGSQTIAEKKWVARREFFEFVIEVLDLRGMNSERSNNWNREPKNATRLNRGN